MTIFPTSDTVQYLSPQIEKVISLDKVGKRYHFIRNIDSYNRQDKDGFWALRDVCLDVQKGQTFGIVGRNGAGKTTLLNIIAGTLTPTCGSVQVSGKVVGLFNLGVGFQDELTGRENVYLNGAVLGATKKEIDQVFTDIVAFSELGSFIDMPLGSYSQGMRLRLGFSIIANLTFDILIIDEVLAVGDVLFQNKCYQRLMEFKRAQKTLIITSQSMELIERLCERVVLLDHGKVLYLGSSVESINRYRDILAKEKFFVGPKPKENSLITQTKRWAQDIECWGKKLGTREIEIESVGFYNRLGRPLTKLAPGDFLRVKVNFLVKNIIKTPHFGAAIFREDGVYVYGPNTFFDGIEVASFSPGRAWFEIRYPHVTLAPGNYRLSVAVMDRDECLPYTYYCGMYPLTISGKNQDAALTALACKPKLKHLGFVFLGSVIDSLPGLDLESLKDAWGDYFNDNAISLASLRLLDSYREEKEKFFTGEPLEIEVKLNAIAGKKDYYLWLAIFRDDRIFCQSLVTKIRHNTFSFLFPSFDFLPGGYIISWGIWDQNSRRFVSLSHGRQKLKMVFDRPDHGTLYMRHDWRLSRLK
ncbi:MAG: Wzt carbohydrate-binding domain-containing protein [Candidatus Omnitrophica bacterium]|nr:Wzt carbohydrate-binding domain-containing protein [Candidatus Omnitrophota bacterium]